MYSSYNSKVQPDDEFADLPVSNQRKWALRNPDKIKAYRKKRYSTPEGKERQKQYNQRYRARKGQ